MKRLAGKLIDRIIAGRNLDLPAERFRAGVIEGWFSITGNLVLSLVKFVFGLITGSVSLLADAVHTASDISSSLAVLIGFHLSRKKPDREHPFGHGRIEYLTGLLIALMLVGVGIAFVFTALDRMRTGAPVQFSLAAILVVVFSIVFKEFMYHFSLRLGQMIDSEALIGDAWHHRSDALSSAAVLVALLGSYFSIHWLDPVLGFGVSLCIIYGGCRVARNSLSRLLGAAPLPEMREDVLNCAREVKGVVDAHDLEVHDYGFIKSITLHIEVDGTLSVFSAHKIAARVEQVIGGRYNCSAVVHLDPCEEETRRQV